MKKNRTLIKNKKTETTAKSVVSDAASVAGSAPNKKNENSLQNTTSQYEINTKNDLQNKSLTPSKTSDSENILFQKKTEIQISYLNLTNNWNCQFEAIAGTKHRNANPSLPCQDAALSSLLPKPFVIVADGAGSSPMSDVGAQTVVIAISRLLSTLEHEVINLLDQENQTADQGRRFALMLVKHARGVLMDLSQMQRRSIKDFRCTLLLAILGKTNLLWLKVGDGSIVQEKMRNLPEKQTESELQTLGEIGKGDFANETIFIDENLRTEDVQSGFLPSKNICGLAAMSDGAALALVSHDGTKVASRLTAWLNELREGNLRKSTLTSSFYNPDFSRRAMGDDCSIALVASEIAKC